MYDNEEELQKLVGIFTELGADNPEDRARSQIEEGLPQLALFCFAKTLWESVVLENNDAWIDRAIEGSKRRPNDPCAQAGTALEQMLAKGVTRQAIVDLVRVTQYEAIFSVCAAIDGDVSSELPVQWSLFEIDGDGNPVSPIAGTHEVLLSADPTKREMRPRPLA